MAWVVFECTQYLPSKEGVCFSCGACILQAVWKLIQDSKELMGGSHMMLKDDDIEKQNLNSVCQLLLFWAQ